MTKSLCSGWSEGMGVVSVTTNLIIAAAGAGMLSFPFAMMKSGLVLGVSLCLFFAFLNIYSLHSLVSFSLSCPHHSHNHTRPSSYHDLIRTELGPAAGVVANASVLFGIFGTLVGFLIIIADLVCPVMELWVENSTDFAFISHRYFVILVFVAFVALPLSCLPSLKSLVFSSFLAVISVLFVVFVVIYRCTISHSILSFSDYSVNSPESWWSIFESMPIMLFAFGCPLQTVATVSELPKNSDISLSMSIMKKATFYTIMCCVCMYLGVGIFGYIQFGTDTDGVILDNYANDDKLVNVARILMALHVAMAYPVLFYPAQCSLVELLLWLRLRYFHNSHIFADVEVESEEPLLTGNADDDGQVWPFRVENIRGLCTLAVATITASLAIAVPQVEIVFGLMGSLVATTQVLLLPSALLLKHSDGKCDQCDKLDARNGMIESFPNITPYLMILVGVIVAFAGTISYTIDLIYD